MLNIFRGRPYGRLLRQLDDARHTLITETAKAEEAAAKATLAKAQIDRLEGWIREEEDNYKRRHAEPDSPGYPRHGSNTNPTYAKPPAPPMPPHMHGYQPHPA